MAALTHLTVKLYVHCLSCSFLTLSVLCSSVELHKFTCLHLTRFKVYKRRQMAVRQQFFRIRVFLLTHPLGLIFFFSQIPFLPITVTSMSLNGLSCVSCQPVIIYPLEDRCDWPLLPRTRTEHCFESSQASPTCPYDENSIMTKISMEHWWNDTGRGKPTYSEKTLSPYRFLRVAIWTLRCDIPVVLVNP